MTTVKVVIVSKDRACQLDQLLRSLDVHFRPRNEFRVCVLYCASTADFRSGYALTKALHPAVDFVEETRDFTVAGHLTRLIHQTSEPFFAFMVDDDVAIRPFSLSSPQFQRFMSDDEVSFLSLRLSPEICYNQIQGRLNRQPLISPAGEFEWRQKKPNLRERLLRRIGAQATGFDWFWTGALSMDGDINRTEFLQSICDHVRPVRTVGDYEQELGRFPPPGSKALCFSRARLVNLPLNRVDSSSHDNPHQELAPSWLNEQFLAGKRLRFDWLSSMLLNSVHVESPIFWEEGDVSTVRGHGDLPQDRA